jgi:hypothetical protein
VGFGVKRNGWAGTAGPKTLSIFFGTEMHLSEYLKQDLEFSARREVLA